MNARPQPLPKPPDPAILALVRALARQAAREDHAAENARQRRDEERGLYGVLKPDEQEESAA